MQHLINKFSHWFILLLIVKSGLTYQNNLGGWTCIVLLKAVLSVECASDCSISEYGKTADCSMSRNRSLRLIPQDLNQHISKLDLTGNPFVELREKSFTKYRSLTSLTLRDVHINLIKVDLYLFRPLENLRILNLTGSSFGSIQLSNDITCAYFYWPINLRILDIRGLFVDDTDLSHLQYLKELYASRNYLRELPIIHELAPLTYVDLEGNHLDDLSPERLAPFCKLEFLNVQLNPEAKLLSSPARYCICKRANLWISSFKIKGKPLSCIVPPNGGQCEETFSEDALLVYNDCLARYKKKKSYKVYVIIGAIILLLLGAAIGGYFIYYYYIAKPSSDEGDSKADPVEVDTEDK